MCHVGCGTLVPDRGLNLRPQWSRVLTTGPSGKSLPLVLDFDQMRCSCRHGPRSSPTLLWLQKCFRIAVPGRAWVFVSCLLALIYLLSVFPALLFLFQLHPTVLCFSSCLFATKHMTQPSAAAAVFSLPTEPSFQSFSCLPYIL